MSFFEVLFWCQIRVPHGYSVKEWFGVDVRCGGGMIMMMLFGLLEREEDREAMDRMMVEAVRRGGGLGLTQPRGRGIHGLHRDAGNLAKHKVPWR